ncbi:MAG: hypothetical protein M1833_002800 [Piccolia ochrophora]|nr:MAG: hypothetical protein M1833_002800 [Piccolia ochrophora]
MTSFFSKWSPVPSFPPHKGPYTVGTVDVELPVADLPSPTPAPDPSITTVHFRLFYPCSPPEKPAKAVRWISAPQREQVSAYARFLGVKSSLGEAFSYLPNLFYYITIPALRNAPLLQPPTKSKRWPVLVFSHGLGGSRNSYSAILGAIASHGVVVATPDHRDGSGPDSYIRTPPSQSKDSQLDSNDDPKSSPRTKIIPYKHISHDPSPEVDEARNGQFRTRLWELGLVHAALLALDSGASLRNLDNDALRGGDLTVFRNLLAVHEPGSITWAGHSFGAATIVQFLKAVFYSSTTPSSASTLMTPDPGSPLTHQITPSSPAVLLDLWPFPVVALDSTRALLDLPLPCFTGNSSPSKAPPIVAILSEAFHNWTWCLQQTRRVLTPPTSTHQPARLFYAPKSAHLSQSDFGVLFPRLTRTFFRAENPERTVDLNVRAALQVMREGGAELGEKADEEILRRDGGVEGWISIDPREGEGGVGNGKVEAGKRSEVEAMVDGEVLREGK